MLKAFSRIAIINRGEPAIRLINAVRELNHHRAEKLVTIALFTEPDRRAWFVREADEAYTLGPAFFMDPADGLRKSSYLDLPRLERALLATRAEAAWVGWGFASERPELVELCDRLGVVFIGPTAEAMRLLGDKIAAKSVAERAGIPVVPWSGGPVDDAASAQRIAAEVGWPLLVKATAGGGGRGIRRVEREADLPHAFQEARAEAIAAFGSPIVYLERLITGARHVEVQIAGDVAGTVWAAGVRDCSIQRRHQKVLEEAPCPALTPAEDTWIRAAARRLGEAVGYRNVGTVELLFEESSRNFYFLEVNTRLQVEHPVTELTTGLDLVKLQLHLAAGGLLTGAPPDTRGHAIEVRLTAEDPEANFAPTPGLVRTFRLPSGPGVRVDTGVVAGDTIAPEFDSMIAKLVAHGATREEALDRLDRALRETALWVEHGQTNRAFAIELVGHPDVVAGRVDTGWLERALPGAGQLRPFAAIALLAAGVEAYEAARLIEQSKFFLSADRQRPEVSAKIGLAVDLRHAGQTYMLGVSRAGRGRYQVDVAGETIGVVVEPISASERWITVAGRRHRVVSFVEELVHLVEVDGVTHRVTRDDGGVVRATSPAIVVSVSVEPGAIVARGAPLATLEAMKLEMTVAAPCAGRVRRVLAVPNTQVGPGAPLVEIEPDVDHITADLGQRVSFAELRAEPSAVPTRDEPGAVRGSRSDGEWDRERTEPHAEAPCACARYLDPLLALVLGFDVSSAAAREAIEAYQGLGRRELDARERLQYENGILEAFADLGALFRGRAPSEDPEVGASSAEYFLDYLRSLDFNDPALPASFKDRLRAALAHHGVTSMERSPALEEALFWIFKSRRRTDAVVPALYAILTARLADLELLRDVVPPAQRTLLDRLIAVTQHRHAALHDLAREVRYRYFDQPVLEKRQAATYREVEARLAELSTAQPPEVRAAHIEGLLQCAEPLEGLFAAHFASTSATAREAMLEALVRRYYRIRPLEPVETGTRSAFSFARSAYTWEGRRTTLFAFSTHFAALEQVLAFLASGAEGAPEGHDVVAELHVIAGWPDELAPPDRSFAGLLHILTGRRPVRRIVFANASREVPKGAPRYLTFRTLSGERYEEDARYRGIHPMIAKRLGLSRLSEFEIARLASPPEIHLLLLRAKGNAKDERLFAVSEVRDTTPIRDDDDRMIGLPQLERQWEETIALMRAFQAQREPERRLYANQVHFEVWAPISFTRREVDHLIRRLAASSTGCGIETVTVHASMPDPETGAFHDTLLTVTAPEAGAGLRIHYGPPATRVVEPLTEYAQKVVRMRQRGLPYPYEIIDLLTSSPEDHGDLPPGELIEHDLDGDNRLVPVTRAPGRNSANVVVGVIQNRTRLHPEGIRRVVLLGDPSREMGSLAEAECRRIIAAIDLARRLAVPLEWFALSAGAKISMESGTENMDWISRVLRALVDFTQEGGEVNIVVTGINVGAQPYWNAEATMLMHTRGILIMTDDGAMVLTGKTALDYSGSVSAEDNFGIGGFDRIMGPNGQAQYFAPTVQDACLLLMRHYEATYVVPGERFPRRAETSDPRDRDITRSPLAGDDGLTTLADLFSGRANPGRKRPFDVRKVMAATIDQDHPPLERWSALRDGEIAVVWDARLGGRPVCLLGFESRPLPRFGATPIDGPDHWTPGTLFPMASKKIARAINAASGNRPLVVLANLSGFDGSPESMRKLQLEYGAEIGRAVVNFEGPIVFGVISRYHGGAFVVFSKTLNDNMHVFAVEGSFASVIGGAPAAAVVFAREVEARTDRDPRIAALQGKKERRAELDRQRELIRSEKLGEIAAEFDRVHSVERALRVGSIDAIVPARMLRPHLIDSIEAGIEREQAVTRVRQARERPAPATTS